MSPQFDARKLAEDLEALVRDGEALLRAAAQSTEEMTETAKQRAEESLNALRAHLAGVERELQGRAELLDGYVHKHPWRAVAITGGVALLVGLLMGRR